MLAAAAGSFIACESTGPSDRATFEGRWANQEWIGDASAARFDGRIKIYGTYPLNAGQVPLHLLKIGTTATAPGTYQLGAGDAEFTYLVGGDVRTATYGIPEGGSGTLTIETLTDSTVTGSVLFGAARIYSNGDPPVGELAIFEGTFNARIVLIPSSSSVR